MKAGLRASIPDLSNIEQDVMRAVKEEMTNFSEEMLEDIKKFWTGWKYEGRPPGWINISQAAWSVSIDVESRQTMDRATIILKNDAVDWRHKYYKSKGRSDLAAKYRDRPYVYYPQAGRWVARRRGGTSEYLKVLELISKSHIPELERRIRERIVGEVRQAPQSVQRPSRFSGFKRVMQKLLSPFRRS